MHLSLIFTPIQEMFEWASFTYEEARQQTIEEKEEEFNNVVREYIINLLSFIVLYLIAYVILARYHQKKERDGLYGGDEDAKAYRISFYLCAFTLAVACGSMLMLPMSMIGNEIVHLFPDSYWVQWLNGALIHTFWKWIFILSNTSLFILLPFSYFFTESEGFSGQRRGLMPRVYETIAVLLLLAALVFGLAVLALAFFDNDDSAQDILLMVGEYYLQYLYSFLLCICVLFMLSACAPLGFTILFDSVGQVLVKPKILENNNNQIYVEQMEEEALKQKYKSEAYFQRLTADEQAELRKNLESVEKTRIKLERRKNASALERNLGYPLAMLVLLALTGLALFLVSFHVVKLVFIGDYELHPSTVKGFQKDYRYKNVNKEKACENPSNLDELLPKKDTVPTFWKWWPWSTSDEAVVQPPPTICPPAEHPSKLNSHSLGADSLSSFGIIGTILEVLVIFYLMIASVVGLYNLPGFKMLRPELHETPMTKIILNCLVLQLLSCSLPVLSRVLGITDFELQGNFGNFYWLGNFYIVFSFNIIFAAVTALCLGNKMTMKMRKELLKALRFSAFSSNVTSTAWHGRHQSAPSSPSKTSTFTQATKHTDNEPATQSGVDNPLLDSHAMLSDKLPSIEAELESLKRKSHEEASCKTEKQPFLCSPSRSAVLTKRNVESLPKRNGI